MQISSDKQTILLFSDVHQEIDKLESILQKENYDIAVCLGDWFDSHYFNSEADWAKTCNFLKKWIFKPNFYTCLGNHDIQYLFSNHYTICSGYSGKKNKFIIDSFGASFPAIRDKFLWYIWIDDFLCSHAGVNVTHFAPHVQVTKESITKWLDGQIKSAEPALINGGAHWLYGAGAARGGRQSIGGITWQDFNSEFEPIDDLKQIVGHTNHRGILNPYEDGHVDLTQSNNLDIDCHLKEYVTILNGVLSIKKNTEL